MKSIISKPEFAVFQKIELCESFFKTLFIDLDKLVSSSLNNKSDLYENDLSITFIQSHENKHCQTVESLIKRSFVRTKGFQQSKNSITIL